MSTIVTFSYVLLHNDLFFYLQGKVTNSMNLNLIRSFAKEEIQSSLFSMHPSKAQRKDNMPAIFYKKYWKLVGDLVTKAYMHFLNEDGINDLNHTLLLLSQK